MAFLRNIWGKQGEIERIQACDEDYMNSMNRFIEESMDVNSESMSEESDRDVEVNSQNNNYMDENEKRKKAMELSIKNMDFINSKKDKDKEQIEDDATSVVSSKIMLDNFKKYNLPYIIGTEDFNKEATIGLTNEQPGNDDDEEDNDENNELIDNDVKDFVEENVVVDAKLKDDWVKIEEKKKKKKEKDKAKKQKKDKKIENENVNKENKDNFDDEIKNEIKVPSEQNDQDKNGEDNNIAITSNIGGSVPPPPPPPPKPVLDPSKFKHFPSCLLKYRKEPSIYPLSKDFAKLFVLFRQQRKEQSHTVT